MLQDCQGLQNCLSYLSGTQDHLCTLALRGHNGHTSFACHTGCLTRRHTLRPRRSVPAACFESTAYMALRTAWSERQMYLGLIISKIQISCCAADSATSIDHTFATGMSHTLASLKHKAKECHTPGIRSCGTSEVQHGTTVMHAGFLAMSEGAASSRSADPCV